MSTTKQKTAARRNVAKAKKTISQLSKGTRTALGNHAAEVAEEHRAHT